MEIKFLCFILFAHWVADFVGQSDYMAKGKSSNNWILLWHITVYTGLLGLMTAFRNPTWALLNGAIHFVVDWFTSRASSKLYKDGKIHEFFVVIGFDQFIHTALLIYTWTVL